MLPVKQTVLGCGGSVSLGYATKSVISGLTRYGVWDDIIEIAASGPAALYLFITALYPPADHQRLFTDLDIQTVFKAPTGLNLWQSSVPHKIAQMINHYICERLGSDFADISFQEWHDLKETRPELQLKDFSCWAVTLEAGHETLVEFSYRTLLANIPINLALQATMAGKRIKGQAFWPASPEVVEDFPSDFHFLKRSILQICTTEEVKKKQLKTDEISRVYLDMNGVTGDLIYKGSAFSCDVRSNLDRVGELAFDQWLERLIKPRKPMLPVYKKMTQHREQEAVCQVLDSEDEKIKQLRK